jgi:molybdopterin synthase catalytic subunit
MIRLVREPIDKLEITNELRKDVDGAMVTFDGVVRNHAMGKPVRYLEYEAYEEMALKKMAEIREYAKQKWPVSDVAIVHRLGRLEIGETSVFIAVAAPHRRPAFEACQYAIDTLKKTVPIWKKEYYTNGEAWIEGQS